MKKIENYNSINYFKVRFFLKSERLIEIVIKFSSVRYGLL